MYEIDKKPNSDQEFCENCECLVDKLDIMENIDGSIGCINCISKCNWCGNWYFNDEMYQNPYLGYACDACLNCDDYMEASRQAIEKDALRCLFDQTTSKEIEKLIIKLARKKGYYELSDELKNDKS